MSVQAWFSQDEALIDPGSTITLTLTVHNLGDATDSYTILPGGLTASWVTVSRPNITLFGGSQEVVELDVSPPAVPTTPSGPTVVAIRVLPASDADDAVVAETTLQVTTFDDTRLVALQPVQRSRRRANYEFMVENHGNSLASCRLHLVDPTDRVDGSFDPPAVGVAPGGSSLVRLRARARGAWLRRATRTLDFEVESEQQGRPPASTSMALVQPPTVSGAAVAKTIAVIAVIAAFIAAWFGVVRPEIQDAADRAVDDRIDELEPESETEATAVPEATDDSEANAATPVPTVETGTPTLFRLRVEPALTQVADDTRTIPDGGTFDMTDVRVENPFNDGGQATLSINGEPLYVWSLQNVRGQLFEPSITPIRLNPGDNVTLSVRCDQIGDAAQTTCSTAVNIGGSTATT